MHYGIELVEETYKQPLDGSSIVNELHTIVLQFHLSTSKGFCNFALVSPFSSLCMSIFDYL